MNATLPFTFTLASWKEAAEYSTAPGFPPRSGYFLTATPGN